MAMEEQTQKTRGFSIFLKLLVGFLTTGLTLWLLLLVFYTPRLLPLVFFDPTITPTYFTSTPQPTFTQVATATATPTITPTITPTPMAQSSYLVADVASIHPDFAFKGGSVLVIDESTALVDPPLDSIQWISSAQISQDIGYDIPEPYSATFSPGSITWFTDLPIKPALYEIFVMDTLFSSGGELTFEVRLDDQLLTPIAGVTTIQYQSSQLEPPQYNDIWQSIGFFNVEQPGIISVFTEWGSRDNRTIVAIDRILILEHTDHARQIIEKLPLNNSQVTIVDDYDAVFTARQYWDYWEDLEGWGEQYQLLSDSPTAASVTWTAPQLKPWGEYEVYVWVPRINGTAPVTYQFYAAGIQQSTTDGVADIVLENGQGRGQPSQWLFLGTFQIAERYGDRVRFRLAMSVAANAGGDAAADAVAFIRK